MYAALFERKSVSLPLQRPRDGGSTILIRLLVGLVVFLPEGIQKLAFPDVLGAGRFARIGIPLPDMMGPFVGTVEILCGALIVLGLFTRLAAIPLVVVMVVAIVSTKIPILLGHDLWIFHLSADMKRTGLWSMLHEARNDLTMLLGSIYLVREGSGRWSLDAHLETGFASKPSPSTAVAPLPNPLDRTFQRIR
jgi:putative oxidoreductase